MIGSPMKVQRIVFGTRRAAHFCEACRKVHVIPFVRDGYAPNYDTAFPTFDKSILSVEEGGWTCHYSIHAGVIHYHSDSSHDWRGKSLLLAPYANASTHDLDGW